jgi:hypothetical protein
VYPGKKNATGKEKIARIMLDDGIKIITKTKKEKRQIPISCALKERSIQSTSE